MYKELPDELLVRPLGEVLKEISISIAGAQKAMDASSILTQKTIEAAIERGELKFEVEAPWYRFSEVEVELKVALSISTRKEKDKKGRFRGFKPVIMVSPLNAVYKNRFDYSEEGASQIRAKIVPVPSFQRIE